MVKVVLSYNNTKHHIEVDPSDSAEIVKLQFYSITGVPPENQTILCLKGWRNDLNDLHSLQIKEGQKIILFGQSEKTNAPNTENKEIPSSQKQNNSVISSNQKNIAWKESCSRIFFNEPIQQPMLMVKGKPICHSCATTCHLPNEISSPLITNSNGSSFMCQCINVPGKMCLFTTRLNNPLELINGNMRELVLGELRSAQQQQIRSILSPPTQATTRFQQEIQATISRESAAAMIYEDPNLQRKALELIPVDTLTERAKKSPQALSHFRDELFRQLLLWFKREFFKWIDTKNCSRCNGKTQNAGVSQPTQLELQSKAFNVEIHKCTICGFSNRFPRYNDPWKLLETREGRCGEWANCFTLMCRAMKFEARFVWDKTDHVWTEVYSEGDQRWMHSDPCEPALDSPMMYEAGWGKKLSYVFAFSANEAIDVTKRYTRKWNDVLTRRNVDENWLSNFLRNFNAKKQESLPPNKIQELKTRFEKELVDMEANIKSTTPLKEEELKGRISGSKDWKEGRGESGPDLCATSSDNDSDTLLLANFQTKVFEFNDFQSLNNLNLIGSASQFSNRLRITPKRNSATGGVWFKEKIKIGEGFESNFMFQVTDPGADGFAFVIQNSSEVVLGEGGCHLGYGGIPKSIAIEFDTYQTFDRTLDPNGNHISIQTNGGKPNTADHNYSLACNSNLKVKINDEKEHKVKIVYFGNVLGVFLDGELVVSTKIDLPQKLETLDGLFWLGFTASTGGLSENHDILSWNVQI